MAKYSSMTYKSFSKPAFWLDFSLLALFLMILLHHKILWDLPINQTILKKDSERRVTTKAHISRMETLKDYHTSKCHPGGPLSENSNKT